MRPIINNVYSNIYLTLKFSSDIGPDLSIVKDKSSAEEQWVIM